MLEFDHVGIAVENLDSALALWRDQLGAELGPIEEVESERVRVAFLRTGATKTELLEPTSADSAVARFLASGRKGVHHLAYRVDDLDAVLAELRKKGVALIHDEPVSGSRGTRIAFLHPKGTGGVLLELVEHPTPEENPT